MIHIILEIIGKILLLAGSATVYLVLAFLLGGSLDVSRAEAIFRAAEAILLVGGLLYGASKLHIKRVQSK